MVMDNERLVEGIKRKDEKALECLIAQYGGLIKSIAYYHLSMDAGYAGECINDVLLIIWTKIGQFHPEKNTLKNWIGAVCRYKCIDYKRKYYREHFEPLDETFPAPDTPEKRMLEQEMIRETEEFLSCLSISDREIFRRRYIEEQSISEISGHMKLSPSVLYNRLSKGKKKLRKSLGRCHDETGI